MRSSTTSSFVINGRPASFGNDVSKEVVAAVQAPAGGVVTLDVQYQSRGLGSWTYAFAPSGVAQVRDFNLVLRTNFRDINFPAGTVSPGVKAETANGWTLTWTFANLISGQAIGMELPEKLNPGPFAARVTFFAPVSLLFFLAVMVMVGATSGPSLHPMHYWFIAAAFFAFHLLLAYLVDHVSVHVAFAIAAVVSLALVVSYLRVVTGMRDALLKAGVAQAIFLVLFSYAFFFEGFTGLAITVGAIVTLFVDDADDRPRVVGRRVQRGHCEGAGPCQPRLAHRWSRTELSLSTRRGRSSSSTSRRCSRAPSTRRASWTD